MWQTTYTMQEIHYISSALLDLSTIKEIIETDKQLGLSEEAIGNINRSYSYLSKKIKENEFDLIVEDLGIINWGKNSQNYTVDTICHFQGIVIEDIFHFNDSILENSINNLNSHYNENQNKYSLRLPVKIKASFTRNLNNTTIDFIKLNSLGYPLILAGYSLTLGSYSLTLGVPSDIRGVPPNFREYLLTVDGTP